MAVVLPQKIATKHLVLRKPRIADAAQVFAAYTQSAEVSRYMVWRPHKELAETEAFMEMCVEAWNKGTRYPFVLALNGDEMNPLGMVEARPQSSTVDIGYVLAQAYWGRGFMAEVLHALVDACLVQPGVFRIQATCDVENRASARVLEKVGFVKEGRLERYTLHPNISSEPRPCFMYAKCQ